MAKQNVEGLKAAFEGIFTSVAKVLILYHNFTLFNFANFWGLLVC